jgi:ethanolamine utilization protein EutM
MLASRLHPECRKRVCVNSIRADGVHRDIARSLSLNKDDVSDGNTMEMHRLAMNRNVNYLGLSNAHTHVHLLRKKMANRNAIGILETKGFSALMQGADAALKSASVELVEWRQVGSGYVSFTVEGDVAAVRSSIEAAVEAAATVGEVLSQVVIPRPVEELESMFKQPTV